MLLGLTLFSIWVLTGLVTAGRAVRARTVYWTSVLMFIPFSVWSAARWGFPETGGVVQTLGAGLNHLIVFWILKYRRAHRKKANGASPNS
jgi:hypothetical protein